MKSYIRNVIIKYNVRLNQSLMLMQETKIGCDFAAYFALADYSAVAVSSSF